MRSIASVLFPSHRPLPRTLRHPRGHAAIGDVISVSAEVKPKGGLTGSYSTSASKCTAKQFYYSFDYGFDASFGYNIDVDISVLKVKDSRTFPYVGPWRELRVCGCDQVRDSKSLPVILTRIERTSGSLTRTRPCRTGAIYRSTTPIVGTPECVDPHIPSPLLLLAKADSGEGRGAALPSQQWTCEPTSHPGRLHPLVGLRDHPPLAQFPSCMDRACVLCPRLHRAALTSVITWFLFGSLRHSLGQSGCVTLVKANEAITDGTNGAIPPAAVAAFESDDDAKVRASSLPLPLPLLLHSDCPSRLGRHPHFG